MKISYHGQITNFFRRHPIILVVALAMTTIWFEEPTVKHMGYLLAGVLIGHFYWSAPTKVLPLPVHVIDPMYQGDAWTK